MVATANGNVRGERIAMSYDRAFPLACGVTLAALAGLAALALMLWVSTPSPARTLYPGQWAQVDPQERAWFKAQRSPLNGVPCCDESDGTYAEESLTPPKDGATSDGKPHYWTQFSWKRCLYNGAVVAPSYLPSGSRADCEDVASGWMEVPDDVVIHDPNRHGAPVVWWAVDGARVRIRCYAPGAGI
jgi:hypothetical protein